MNTTGFILGIVTHIFSHTWYREVVATVLYYIVIVMLLLLASWTDGDFEACNKLIVITRMKYSGFLTIYDGQEEQHICC